MKENNTVYGVDKIEFLSIQTKQNVQFDLRAIRPISKKLGIVTVHSILEKNDKEIFKQGYRSKIILSRIPNEVEPELFNKLQKVEFLFQRPHIVEIFKDMVCTHKEEAIALANEQIRRVYMIYKHGLVEHHLIDTKRLETYRKIIPSKTRTEEQLDSFLYPSYAKGFEKDKSGLWKRKQEKEFIGTKTLYVGAKDDVLAFVIYARLSKEDGQPVVHSEFRFKGQKAMQKLGILDRKNGTLNVIQNYLISNSAKIYDDNLQKRIKFNDINWQKLARLSFGWENRKKFNMVEEKRLGLCIRHLRQQIPIYTAGFVAYAEDMGLDRRQYLK